MTISVIPLSVTTENSCCDNARNPLIGVSRTNARRSFAYQLSTHKRNIKRLSGKKIECTCNAFILHSIALPDNIIDHVIIIFVTAPFSIAAAPLSSLSHFDVNTWTCCTATCSIPSYDWIIILVKSTKGGLFSLSLPLMLQYFHSQTRTSDSCIRTLNMTVGSVSD